MIDLKTPEPLDVRRTFRWLQDDSLRDDFMSSSKPTMKSHFLYWRSVLNRRTSDIFLSIIYDGCHIGNCGLKNIIGNSGELWIYIGDRKNRGLGLGRAAVSELIKFSFNSGFADLHLFVRTDNIPAVTMYRNIGFLKTFVNNARNMGFNADISVMRMDYKL